MKVLTILALLVATCAVLFGVGYTEDTSEVDNFAPVSPDDVQEKSATEMSNDENGENDDDDDVGEDGNEVTKEVNSEPSEDEMQSNDENEDDVLDDESLNKRSPSPRWRRRGRRRRRRRRRRRIFRIRIRGRRIIRKVGKVIQKVLRKQCFLRKIYPLLPHSTAVRWYCKIVEVFGKKRTLDGYEKVLVTYEEDVRAEDLELLKNY